MKKSTELKKTNGFCVLSPSNQLIISTIRSTLIGSWSSQWTENQWIEKQKEGYKCIKVDITQCREGDLVLTDTLCPKCGKGKVVSEGAKVFCHYRGCDYKT